VGRDQALEQAALDERAVAVEHEQRAARRRQRGASGQDGGTGALGALLADQGDRAPAERAPELVLLRAADDHDPAGLEGQRGIDRPADRRPAPERRQDLGPGSLEALALSGREDDDSQVSGHVRHEPLSSATKRGARVPESTGRVKAREREEVVVAPC
jgi:hypothetical protein